jgi:hypothetical protein
VAATLLAAAGAPSAGAAGILSLFEARAAGSVGSFSFFAPEAVFPQTVTGGMLESTGLASSSPRGFGMAGLLPVPVATSVDLLVPEVIPGTDIPIPEDGKAAFKSIDFSALPHSCQASFPSVREGANEAFCGGPYQRDPALGFTAGTLGGHVTARGDLEDPLATSTVSTSRAMDLEIPGLQATIHDGWSQSVTGVNDRGIPQGRGVAEIDSLELLGALVKLEGIRSETIVATDGTEEGTAARSEFVVRGAYIAGVPVILGADGVSINRQAVPNSDPKPLAAAVEAAMANAGGLKIRLVPAPPVVVNGGTVRAQSGAVEISYQSPTPTPMDVIQRFGYSLAVVNAVTSSDDATGEAGTDLFPAVPAADEGGTAAGSSAVPAGSATPAASLALGEGALSPGETSAAGLSALPSVGAFPTLVPADTSVPEPVSAPAPAPPDVAARTSRLLGDQSLLVPAVVTLPANRVERLYGGLAGLLVLGLVLVGLVLRGVTVGGRGPAGPEG